MLFLALALQQLVCLIFTLAVLTWSEDCAQRSQTSALWARRRSPLMRQKYGDSGTQAMAATNTRGTAKETRLRVV